MAKLSARGRTELVRLVKNEAKNPDSDIISGKKTLVLMSDGKVLEKRDVVFKPSPWDSIERPHTWGWKLKGRIRPGMTKESFTNVMLDCGYALA